MEYVSGGHIFEKGSTKDHICKVLLNLAHPLVKLNIICIFLSKSAKCKIVSKGDTLNMSYYSFKYKHY